MKKILSVLLIALLIFSSIPIVFALIPIEPKETIIKPTPTPIIEKQPDENTTINYVYQGETKITTALIAEATEKSKTELSEYEKSVVLSKETSKIMATEKYPVEINNEIRIEKFRCNNELGVCGYWIYATRNGYQVKVNNPIWISPPPYLVVLSETYDSKNNNITVIVKEDAKTAVFEILQRYVSDRPIGSPITGTIE